MKKATIILLAVAFPVFMFAQTSSMEKLFKKYEKYQGFEMEVSDTSIDLDFDGDSGFMQFLDEAESFYVLNFEYGEGDTDGQMPTLEEIKTIYHRLSGNWNKGILY